MVDLGLQFGLLKQKTNSQGVCTPTQYRWVYGSRVINV